MSSEVSVLRVEVLLVLNFCSIELCHAAQHPQTEKGSFKKVVLKKREEDTNRNLFQHLLKKPPCLLL